MTRLSLAPPLRIALSHVGFVFFNAVGCAPVRQVVALAGEDVHGFNQPTIYGTSVFVPSFTAVNAEIGTPSTVNLSPLLISQNKVMTLLNSFSLREVFKCIQCALWVLPVVRFPSIINVTNLPATVWALRHVESLKLLSRLNICPKAFRIFKIKKLSALNRASLSAARTSNQKDN